MNNELNIKVNMDGMEEAVEKTEQLADALGDFPAQVTIKYATNCTFNIHPSQIMTIEHEPYNKGVQNEEDNSNSINYCTTNRTTYGASENSQPIHHTDRQPTRAVNDQSENGLQG